MPLILAGSRRVGLCGVSPQPESCKPLGAIWSVPSSVHHENYVYAPKCTSYQGNNEVSAKLTSVRVITGYNRLDHHYISSCCHQMSQYLRVRSLLSSFMLKDWMVNSERTTRLPKREVVSPRPAQGALSLSLFSMVILGRLRCVSWSRHLLRS